MEKKDKIIIIIDVILIVLMSLFAVWIIYSCVCPMIIGIQNIQRLGNERNIEKIELYSIENTDTISGSFFLGSGKINETKYYCCYRKLDDGGLQYYEFEVDKTTVYETLQSGSQAYVEVVTNGYGNIIEYKLYVPKDTIVQTIDLSLSN